MQNGTAVIFEGRRLTETERWYEVTAQTEMLAAVYDLQKWCCYLEGRHFTVYTDHQPNVWFDSQSELSPCQHQWYADL